MAASPFNQADETALLLADRSSIVQAMTTFAFPATGAWLPGVHVAIAGIEKDHRPGGALAIPGGSLSEYLAAAAPTHCADGWSYLSRALHSYLMGDAHSSWHFSYYAELRAAQSILSGLGCGAFNTWNCVLDAHGAIHSLAKRPTHEMVWLALGFLIKSSTAASSEIAAATKIFGESVPDIVQYAYPGVNAATTSSSWISDWLYDLEVGAEDKGFRNRCSYNPHILTPHRANVQESMELVTSLWKVLEPSPGAAFLQLDKHIVRSALRKAASDSLRLRGTPDPIAAAALEAELRAAYERLVGAAPVLQSIPLDFLANPLEQDHPLLQHAQDYSASPATPRPVLARASLLLRVATGMTQNLLRDAGQESQLGFWLDDLAELQGLVSQRSEMPSSRMDLYLDCVDASEQFESEYAKGKTSLAALMGSPKVRTHLLSQAERVVQWSFAS
ncbi:MULTISPECIES: hypothetical protein [unclassified Variovorax]|uniref:hypothetical protein n=1 Tax=unclassified Variovorax TaxID=663243 RepID=UPI0034E955F8